jgi:hypothetical protein
MIRNMLLAFLLLIVPAAAQEFLDNKAVIEMVQKGVPVEMVITAIQQARSVRFTFTPNDYAEFAQARIGPEILRAMNQKQQAAPVSGVQAQASSQTGPAGPDSDRYLQAGKNEMQLQASVTVPHFSVGGTVLMADVAYQRYLLDWLSVGPLASTLMVGSGDLVALGLFGGVQFAPRIGSGNSYLMMGVGPGVVHARGFGDSTTRFAAVAFAGPRFFFTRNVAFDVRYQLTWIQIDGAGFKNASASSVLLGLTFVF